MNLLKRMNLVSVLKKTCKIKVNTKVILHGTAGNCSYFRYYGAIVS